MNNGKTLLEVENLKIVFNKNKANEVRAVDGISFKIDDHETLGLVGESGCGKTTTGRAITRVYDPSAGKILFNGYDIAALKKRREWLNFRKDIQMVFQDPYASLNPRIQVRDIIGEGLKIHKLVNSKDEYEQRISKLLEEVGLNDDYATRYPHEFSGGQRQRIGIARALAVQPKLIVCDEPISALDVSIQAQIINLLKRLQKEMGLTFLFIAHDLSMVSHISERIAVMCKGKIVEIGDAEKVYHNPQHDYTKSLLSSVPRPNPIEERRRSTIDYEYKDSDFNGEMTEIEENHFILRG